MKKFILITVLTIAVPMLLPTKVWSRQITDSLENTGFIRSYSDLLSLSLDLNNKIEAFKLRTSGLNFDLYPNTDLALSAKFSFEFLIFSVSTSPDFLNMNSDSELRGDSDFFLIETNLTLGDHLIQYLGFKKISGFYLKNSSDFDPSWTYGDPYFQFPKLVYTSLEGNTTYKLNKDYSLFATVASNLRQIRSAGSPLINLSYRMYKIDDRKKLTENSSSQMSQNLEYILSVGYGHTFVVSRNFYFSGTILLGGGFTNTDLTTRYFYERYNSGYSSKIYLGQASVSTGFDNGRYFAGFVLYGAESERFQGNSGSAIFNDRVSFELFFGHRFNAPYFMRKASRKIRSVVPLL